MTHTANRSGLGVALLVLLPAATVAAAAQAASAGIEVESPRNFEVFQRQTKAFGTIAVAGRASMPCQGAEARITGNSPFGDLAREWHSLHFDAASSSFHGDLRIPAGGWYRFELRLLEDRKVVAITEIPHVGVGEVFVVAGQSNATNYGEVRQQTRTRMVAASSAEGWRLANDPQPGVQDGSSKGSFIPAFGDVLFERFHVPIGVAAVGHGSTSVRQWLPEGQRFQSLPTMSKFVHSTGAGEWESDGVLFDGMMKVIAALGPHGFRALLWHQGESDAHQGSGHEISGAEYQRLLEDVIRYSRSKAGWDFPWFVAQASYHSPRDPADPEIRNAQQRIWESGLALEGPDTDQLGAEYRQNDGRGIHFSEKGLQAHGRLWAEKVAAWLDVILQ